MEKGSSALNARPQTVLLAVCLSVYDYWFVGGLLRFVFGVFFFFHFVTKSY